MKNSISNIKKEFRKKQFSLRKKIFSNITKVFDEYLFEELFKKINIEELRIVSSFNSINTEIDTSQLNNFILKKNKTLCFPIVENKNKHLIFRKFTKSNDMIKGFMGIQEPPITNELIIPQLLFVPCLAFDDFGFRLGYGGGYYDRTFSYFKNIKRKFISVGYAFDDQKLSEVPKDKFDIRLDYVITEKKFYSFI